MFDLANLMALLRGLHLAAMVSLLGTAAFIVWMLPAAAKPSAVLRRRLYRLCRVSGGVAILAGAAWFVLQTAAIADAESWAALLDALPVVAVHTRYGTVMLARLLLVLAATSLGYLETWRGAYLTLLLSAFALASEGFIGHAGAKAGAIGDELVISEACHLLAAGLWLGGLWPLFLSVQALPPAQAAVLCERFTPMGIACVLVLAGTGFAQGMDFIGSLPGLFGTTYGHFALLKLTLFLIALALALLNRLWLADRLAAGTVGSRRGLMLSICVETGTGLAIVCAAAFMASTPPAVHMTPVWPFAWRFSLDNVTENPDIRRKVIISAALIGGAAALLLGAVLRKRFRLPALLVLAIVVVVRSPSLGLLTVEAYPTSFQTSTTGFAAAAIVRGQALYGPHCASCHGPDGQGNGPAAAALRVKPTDLTLPHLWAHGDGEMFWWLSHGMDDPEGGLAMPSFAQTMSADDRWALIDYIRAHNAGLAMRRDPAFDHRVKAPGFAVACNGVNAANMADLLGHIVDVTADEAPLPAPAGDTMINIALQEDSRPAAGGCAAAEPAALAAYAILADLPPERLAGTEFLVDSNGWLQAVLRPGSNGARRTRDDLVAAIRRLAKPSIRSANGGNHEYHH